MLKETTDIKFVASDFLEVQSHVSKFHKSKKVHKNGNKMKSKDASYRKDFPTLSVEDRKQRQNSTDSLHELMKPFLVVAQCFGLMPILGVYSSNSSALRFEWASITVLISLVMSVLLTINIFFYLYAVAVGKFTFVIMSELTHYGSPIIILLLFLQITRGMPKLMQGWKEMEQSMSHFETVSNVSRNTKIIFYSFLFGRTVLALHAIALYLFEVYPCVDNTTSLKLLEAIQVKMHFNIFSITTWTVWKSILALIMSVFVTYSSLFMYLFITLITIVLSARFQQINHCLESIKHETMPSSFWKLARETYNGLSCLTKLLDQHLSSLVLFSFASSLYILCFLLFLNIQPIHTWLHVSYMTFSIIYNIVLTCVMAFCAASVYEESKKSLSVLFSVPSESYCIEVERFLAQVTCDDLALTGHNFFSVTRTLILTLAGTIVTYEIVLVQFNSVSSDYSNNLNSSNTCEKIFPFLNDSL